MRKIIHIVLIILIALFAIGCTKDISSNKSNSLLINNLDEAKSFSMIIEEAGRLDGQIFMTAYGFDSERFKLIIPETFDTITYNKPTIDNIYFSDGLFFFPTRIENGFIRIGTVKQSLVKGHFMVTMSDGYHQVGLRRIEGFFTIIFD